MKNQYLFIVLLSILISVSHLTAQTPHVIWGYTAGGTSFDKGQAVHVDDSGYIFTTGLFMDTIDLDFGNGVSNLISFSNSSMDIFLQKLDSNCNLVWAKAFLGSENNQGMDITSDSQGNVYVVGNFRGTVDFDPNPGLVNLFSHGSIDAFIVKLDINGDLLWAKSIGGSSLSYDTGSGVVVDDDGNVYVTGGFYETVDFDPGTGTEYRTSAGGSSDIYILKLNAEGEFLWVKTFGNKKKVVCFW